MLWTGAGFVLVAMVGCSSGAAVGDACETKGDTAECEDGAVCDADSGVGTVCLLICESDAECASNEKCSGVSGSLKACHLAD